MRIDWTFVLFLLAWGVIAFFGLRYTLRFQQTMKRNRAAGMYDDPQFKRQIRRINMARFGLTGLQLLVAGFAIWELNAGALPNVVFDVAMVILLVTLIPSLIVDHRWQKLMREGARRKDEG